MPDELWLNAVSYEVMFQIHISNLPFNFIEPEILMLTEVAEKVSKAGAGRSDSSSSFIQIIY